MVHYNFSQQMFPIYRQRAYFMPKRAYIVMNGGKTSM